MHWMNCERENDSNWLICPEKRCYNYNDSTAHSILWLAQFVYIYIHHMDISCAWSLTLMMLILEKNKKKTEKT